MIKALEDLFLAPDDAGIIIVVSVVQDHRLTPRRLLLLLDCWLLQSWLCEQCVYCLEPFSSVGYVHVRIVIVFTLTPELFG